MIYPAPPPPLTYSSINRCSALVRMSLSVAACGDTSATRWWDPTASPGRTSHRSTPSVRIAVRRSPVSSRFSATPMSCRRGVGSAVAICAVDAGVVATDRGMRTGGGAEAGGNENISTLPPCCGAGTARADASLSSSSTTGRSKETTGRVAETAGRGTLAGTAFDEARARRTPAPMLVTMSALATTLPAVRRTPRPTPLR